MNQFRSGFDIGGTKISAILLAPDGALMAQRRWPVPENYAALLDLIASTVMEFDKLAGVQAAVGLGLAGIVDHRHGWLTVCKLRWLERQPLRRDLSQKLGRLVRCGNDADCFALSEAVDGAGAGFHHIFAAILGTGVGGAQIVGKRLVTGPHGVNGEWGHLPLPHYNAATDGPLLPCHCGRTGCMEMMLSGGGLAHLHQFIHGAELNAPAIATQAKAGDRAALATLDRYYHNLAKGLSMILLCLDPDSIIIGGGLKDLPGLSEAVTAKIPLYCFVQNVQTRIMPALHGPDSGVRGAAWL